MIAAEKDLNAVSELGHWDVERIRRDFPVLHQTVNGKPLAYLDNAASSQVPQLVIERGTRYLREEHSNIHRGVHYLSQRATSAYEGAREKVRRFINAREARECIFVRGATEGINLVMHGYGRKFVGPGDEIVISEMEHHANIVPWQMLCEEKGARLRVIPMNDAGELLLDEYEALLNERTKIVAVTHVSNALGTVNPIKEIVRIAHARGIPVLVDGAQAAPHLPIDVQDLDCDFYAISGHKMFGPTGSGVLYGKAELLERMNPFMGGGDMIRSVTFERTIYAGLPNKFEAGTPAIASQIGLGAAIDYLNSIDRAAAYAYEQELLRYATERLSSIEGVRVIGTAREKASVISFTVENVHPHDIGTILDQEGIAIRAGHHCAQPVMQHFKIPATARASFAFYNTKEEVDRLAAAIEKVIEVFN
ncbi:cysteine desulfurase [Pyrinomonas methylaliphatogenes]|uniref:Cysteine desulfurase n=1 Tax=Pyrinomonas methylaliphatogenes TaxID=454194 RepID=A0A0B6WXF7_9BACT|nr:cysteine desulfurase [Pyrinomonas methylaliphatogenes]CDM64969.1 cysteine desulfurase-like protein, SufS subfamily [Pyrinomonas methylaliphatogenes]